MADEKPATLQPWQTLRRVLGFDASPWLRLWVEEIQLPDGRIVEDFYTIEMPDFVMIVAFDEHVQIIAECHYKHGPRQVIMALPAGYVDQGEAPLAAAQRELLEETGYGGGEWVALGTFVVDGNRGCGRAHFFLAQQVKYLTTPHSGDLEEREIVLLSPRAFKSAIEDRRVLGLPSVCAFMLACSALAERLGVSPL